MQNFELTFTFPTDASPLRSQGLPIPIQAESLDHAKRITSVLIERSHRTVTSATLTMPADDLNEIAKWVQNSGWIDI